MRRLRSTDIARQPDIGMETTRADDGTVTVRVEGELDLASVPQLRSCLADLASRGERILVLDLAGVTFCDSTALGVFVGAHRRITEVGGTIEFRHAPSGLRQLLMVSGLDQVLHVN